MLVDKSHFKELFDAPEDQISFVKSSSRNLQMRYTFGKDSAANHYHATVVKMQLSRHIPELMPVIVDELQAACADSFKDVGTGTNLPLFCFDRRTDWTPLVAYKTYAKIIARISNRIFIGLPLCTEIALLLS